MKVGSIYYEPERKLASMVWKKKKRKCRENSRMSSLSGGDVRGFLGLYILVYAEFGPDAHKEKGNVT